MKANLPPRAGGLLGQGVNQQSFSMIVDTGYRCACPKCGKRYQSEKSFIGRDRDLTVAPCADCVGKPLHESKHFRSKAVGRKNR